MTPLYTNFQRTQTKYIERLAKLNKYCEGTWENNYNPLQNHRTIMTQSNFYTEKYDICIVYQIFT